MAGERIAGETFDGERKTAIFPGDLPDNPESLFERIEAGDSSVELPDVSVVRFRPPQLEETGGGIKLSVPHIRLDRAMQFLFGDRLA
jgi:predicted YcjX-like family ATPase